MHKLCLNLNARSVALFHRLDINRDRKTIYDKKNLQIGILTTQVLACAISD